MFALFAQSPYGPGISRSAHATDTKVAPRFVVMAPNNNDYNLDTMPGYMTVIAVLSDGESEWTCATVFAGDVVNSFLHSWICPMVGISGDTPTVNYEV